VRISASLAAAPMAHLASTIEQLERAGVDSLHFDIEDGSFVPVMTLGTRIIAELRPLSQLPFDVHLMMVNPEWLLPELKRAGADRVSVHYEACPYPRRVLRRIAELGMRAGLAFNPATALPDLGYLKPHLSFLVILTTEPETPDAPHLPAILDKVGGGKAAAWGRDLEWDVDGGFHPDNVQQAAQAGADTVVVGRALFAGGKIDKSVRALRAALN